jgi:tetratricopeptide (TPR) repeat protein
MALAAHGHTRAADRLLLRSLAWFEALPQGERGMALNRYRYATALRYTGRVNEAHAILAELVAEHPEAPNYLGALGIVHAQLGQRAEAERVAQRLAQHAAHPGRTGPINERLAEHTYTRAVIAAQLGQLDRALELLRQAQANGLHFGPHLHTDPDLAPLRTHAGFREWLRPKG